MGVCHIVVVACAHSLAGLLAHSLFVLEGGLQETEAEVKPLTKFRQRKYQLQPQSSTFTMSTSFLVALLANTPPSNVRFADAMLDKVARLLSPPGCSPNSLFSEWAPAPRYERALDTMLCAVSAM